MPPSLSPALTKKLEFLLELSNDAVLVLDEKGLIVAANEIAAKVFDCSQEALYGTVFRGLRTSDGITPLPYETRPDNLIYQAWFRRSGGDRFLGDVSVSTIIENGEKYYVSLLRDVSVQEESRRQQQLSSAVFENSLQGIVITDERNRMLAANPAFVRLTGYELPELLGRTPNILKSGLHDRNFYAGMWYAITSDGHWQGEIWNRCKNGDIIPAWLTISVVRDSVGKIIHHIAICSNISEHKKTEKKLKRLTDLYSALSEINQLIARRLDQEALFREVCRVAVDYGRLKLACIGLVDQETGCVIPVSAYGEHKAKIEQIRIPIDSNEPGSRAVLNEAIRTGRLVVSNDYLSDPASYHWGEFVKSLRLRAVAAFPISRAGVPIGALAVYAEERDVFDEDLTLLLGRMADDISFALDMLDQEQQRQQAEARIAYLARHDTLTGLHRRNALEEALAGEHAQAERSGRVFSVALIDLDHFKVINDSYGHGVGDEVLVQVAQILRQTFRDTDWVGRWGGEEFLCVLPDTDPELARESMQRLCEMIASTSFSEENLALRLTVSVGIASFPADGRSIADLLVRADAALYRAKREGGDRVERVQQAPSIFLVGGQIEEALREERIVPAYQPIVSLQTGAVVADEALARLRLVNGEILEAGSFIEAAAHLHQIQRIDQAIMHRAMTRCAARLRDGREPRLHFVNASAAFLSHPEMIAMLLERARRDGLELVGPRSGIRPIAIEITEREMLKDRSAVLRSLRPLLDYGLRIALDDFGSGYSSFLYLAELPVSFLKIEQRLANQVVHDARVGAMVRSIASLAKELDLVTIAEGIEDSATADMLRSLGIDWGQGYHFGRPEIE